VSGLKIELFDYAVKRQAANLFLNSINSIISFSPNSFSTAFAPKFVNGSSPPEADASPPSVLAGAFH